MVRRPKLKELHVVIFYCHFSKSRLWQKNKAKNFLSIIHCVTVKEVWTPATYFTTSKPSTILNRTLWVAIGCIAVTIWFIFILHFVLFIFQKRWTGHFFQFALQVSEFSSGGSSSFFLFGLWETQCCKNYKGVTFSWVENIHLVVEMTTNSKNISHCHFLHSVNLHLWHHRSRLEYPPHCHLHPASHHGAFTVPQK